MAGRPGAGKEGGGGLDQRVFPCGAHDCAHRSRFLDADLEVLQPDPQVVAGQILTAVGQDLDATVRGGHPVRVGPTASGFDGGLGFGFSPGFGVQEISHGGTRGDGN